SSVESTPIASKRFLIVLSLSSAARIPLPSATSARAVCSSVCSAIGGPSRRLGCAARVSPSDLDPASPSGATRMIRHEGRSAAVAGLALRSGGRESARSERIREARLLLKNATAPGRIDKIGNGEADRSGLASPAAEDYENRAFPNATIDFAQTQTAIKDARKL